MRKENEEIMNVLRGYWRKPMLVSRLSKEQREMVIEIFFELVEMGREENAKRMSKIMKERNRLLLFLTKEMREK